MCIIEAFQHASRTWRVLRDHPAQPFASQREAARWLAHRNRRHVGTEARYRFTAAVPA